MSRSRSQASESETPVELSSNCYVVEAIKDTKIIKGERHYLVKWKDWPQSTNTWEPMENLEAIKEMVVEFMQKYQSNKKAKDKKKDVRQETPAELPKKTKKIEKEKDRQKKQKPQRPKTSNIQESESESQEDQMRSQSQHKKKQTKQSKKDKMPMQIQSSKQKQRKVIPISKSPKEKTSIPEAKEPKLKQKQTTLTNLNKNTSNKPENTPRQQMKQSSNNPATKTASNVKPSSSLPEEPKIKYTRINYHIIVDELKVDHKNRLASENPKKGLKIYYNVDRRDAATNRPLPVIDVPSQVLLKSSDGQELVVRYLEGYIMTIHENEKDYEEYCGSSGMQDDNSNNMSRGRSKLDSLGRQL